MAPVGQRSRQIVQRPQLRSRGWSGARSMSSSISPSSTHEPCPGTIRLECFPYHPGQPGPPRRDRQYGRYRRGTGHRWHVRGPIQAPRALSACGASSPDGNRVPRRSVRSGRGSPRRLAFRWDRASRGCRPRRSNGQLTGGFAHRPATWARSLVNQSSPCRCPASIWRSSQAAVPGMDRPMRSRRRPNRAGMPAPDPAGKGGEFAAGPGKDCDEIGRSRRIHAPSIGCAANEPAVRSCVR